MAVLLACVCLAVRTQAGPLPVTVNGAEPPVIAPPESFFQSFAPADQSAARAFYKKYLAINGLSLAASGEVADAALQRDYDIVTHMLAGRPDLLREMAARHTHLIIIGRNQRYTDMPEYRDTPDPAYPP